MEQVTAFKANDGLIFTTTLQCEEHEVSLRWREKVDEYINSEYCGYKAGVHRGMCYKMVIGWEQFKSNEQLENT